MLLLLVLLVLVLVLVFVSVFCLHMTAIPSSDQRLEKLAVVFITIDVAEAVSVLLTSFDYGA